MECASLSPADEAQMVTSAAPPFAIVSVSHRAREPPRGGGGGLGERGKGAGGRGQTCPTLGCMACCQSVASGGHMHGSRQPHRWRRHMPGVAVAALCALRGRRNEGGKAWLVRSLELIARSLRKRRPVCNQRGAQPAVAPVTAGQPTLGAAMRLLCS